MTRNDFRKNVLWRTLTGLSGPSLRTIRHLSYDQISSFFQNEDEGETLYFAHFVQTFLSSSFDPFLLPVSDYVPPRSRLHEQAATGSGKILNYLHITLNRGSSGWRTLF